MLVRVLDFFSTISLPLFFFNHLIEDIPDEVSRPVITSPSLLVPGAGTSGGFEMDPLLLHPFLFGEVHK